jgi:quinol monooxygenase YgiN
MATILAHITIRPGCEESFEVVARKLHHETHGTEQGVRAYGYWRGATPSHYYAILSFGDFLTFIAHQTSAHHELASTALGPLIEAIRLEWVDPVVGASTLGPTDRQAVPDDADELTKKYAVRFAAQIADWWLPLREIPMNNEKRFE